MAAGRTVLPVDSDGKETTDFLTQFSHYRISHYRSSTVVNVLVLSSELNPESTVEECL